MQKRKKRRKMKPQGRPMGKMFQATPEQVENIIKQGEAMGREFPIFKLGERIIMKGGIFKILSIKPQRITLKFEGLVDHREPEPPRPEKQEEDLSETIDNIPRPPLPDKAGPVKPLQ